MITLITTIHVLVCVGLIAVVLLQVGRGAGLANIFGGGSSGLFTPSSGGFMAKFTAVLAAVFLITSLYLSLYTKTARTSSIVEKALQQQETTVPQEAPAQEIPAK
jgi:preprotein translocase subunit SecG